MYKVMIVDDEKYIREELKFLINQINNYEIICETGDGDEVLDLVKEHKPDILFLDIELRFINGMTLARQISQLSTKPQIIISTAFDKYAVMGFELNVSDYILKPFSLSRIEKALDKASADGRKHMNPKNSNSVTNKIAVNSNGRVVLTELEDVYYFKSKGNGSELILESNNFNLISSLKELEEVLDPSTFIRIHKSYIVNINKVKEIIPWFNYTCKLRLYNITEELVVSRNYYKSFKDRFLIK